MLRHILIATLLIAPFTLSAKTQPSTAKVKTKIKEVRFVGNTKISSDDLEEGLANKGPAFLGFLGGDYHPEALNTDAMRVRDVYYQHGYLDAQIARPKVSIDPQTHKAIITYRILREGAPYTVSSVRIATLRGIDRNALTRDVKMRKGETFNVETLRQDLRSISKHIGDQGYAFARVEPRFRKNSRAKTITVVYTVLPGSKATIRSIRIKGNKKTRESVIRNYLTLAPGDQYRLSDLLDARDALSRSGMFDSVAIYPEKKSGNKVDLVVDVKEAKTGQIMGAAGYDSMEGLFIEGSFSEKNLFGTGISAGLSASYSKIKKNGTLFFDAPYIGGTRFGLYGGLFKTDTVDDAGHTYGYDKKELGAYLGLRRKITDELSASIDYNYNRVKYIDVNRSIATNGNLDNYIKSAIGLSVTYNDTDNFYTPRRGIYAKGHVEYAGIGTATSGYKLAKYIKSSIKFAAYYGLQDQIGYDLILRYKLQANYIHDLGYIPEAETIHLGGYYNGVRGYRNGSLHPVGGGGTKSAVNSIEASIPLSEKNKVRLTAFADYGVVSGPTGKATGKSVGAQIEWRSPLGDVNFILAKRLNKQGKGSSFEFTVGKEF